MLFDRFHRIVAPVAGFVFVLAGATLSAGSAEARDRAPAPKATIAKAAPLKAAAPTLAKAKAAAPDGKFTSLEGPSETGSVKPTPELAPNCSRSRKQLWVEGEGWVVRKVTTCF